MDLMCFGLPWFWGNDDPDNGWAGNGEVNCGATV